MKNNDKKAFFEKQYLRLYKKLYYCALAVLCSENDAGEAVREGVLAMFAVYSGECTASEFDVKIFSALVETTEKLRRNKGFSRDVEVMKDDVPQVLAEIKKISPKERLCLALNGIAGLSAVDIADMTGMKPLEVRANISDGRERLKKSGLKGLKRGVLIKGQEEIFPIPENLRPENIGEILDNGSMAITSAAIEAANKEPNTVRKQSNIPKIAAAVAVIVVIGGIGWMLGRGRSSEDPKKSDKVIVQEDRKDDISFVGLRRGSYKSLHTFLCENDAAYGSVDVHLFYDNSYSDREISDEMKMAFRTGCIYNGGGNITLLTDSDRTKTEIGSFQNLLQENDKVFDAGNTSIQSCKLDKGKAVFSEHDMMSDTFISKALAENQVYKENGTGSGPYIIGMMLNGDELIAAYGFYLPELIGDKTIYQEYCGFCIFDKNSEELIYEYEQPGMMSELCIGDNGRITVISRYSTGKKAAEAEMYNSGEPAFLPETYENGESSLINEDDIYISAMTYSSELTIMSSVDTSGDMKCTDKMAVTAVSSAIMEKGSDIWLASLSYESDESIGQIMKVDTSAGLEIKAFGGIPKDSAFISQDYINSFAVENGILYIAGSENAAAFDEELNYLGEYKRTVYLDGQDKYDEYWGRNLYAAAVLDGSIVYFAELVSGEDNSDGVLVLESADLSDINAPKITSYKDDTLSAPVAAALRKNSDLFTDDDKYLSVSASYDDNDVCSLSIKLMSLRPEDVVEGKVSRPVLKTVWDENENMAKGYTAYDPDDEIPIRTPGVVSQLDDLKCSIKEIGFSPINGRYICFPHETEIVYDTTEISRNEYYQYLAGDEHDKVSKEWDEDNNERYYLYNSITAKRSYILIDTDGKELKLLGTTPAVTNAVDVGYISPYWNVDGFAVYDDYLYIFESQSLDESYPIKDIK